MPRPACLLKASDAEVEALVPKFTAGWGIRDSELHTTPVTVGMSMHNHVLRRRPRVLGKVNASASILRDVHLWQVFVCLCTIQERKRSAREPTAKPAPPHTTHAHAHAHAHAHTHHTQRETHTQPLRYASRLSSCCIVTVQRNLLESTKPTAQTRVGDCT